MKSAFPSDTTVAREPPLSSVDQAGLRFATLAGLISARAVPLSRQAIARTAPTPILVVPAKAGIQCRKPKRKRKDAKAPRAPRVDRLPGFNFAPAAKSGCWRDAISDLWSRRLCGSLSGFPPSRERRTTTDAWIIFISAR